MARRATVNLDLYQGDTFEVIFRFEDEQGAPVNMSDRTYAAQMRPRAGSVQHTDFTVDSSAAAVGEITLRLTAEQTEGLGSGIWDMQAIDVEGNVTTLFAGRVTVLRGVTR